MGHYVYDADHLRYELVTIREGREYNWLFLPGGPGADSSYFHSLVSLLELPGNVWLVDLPGGGHCPWLENPEAVRIAFQNFCNQL